MYFTSVLFLFFLFFVFVGNYIIPKNVRNLWILLASLFFYGCFNLKYLIVLFLVILSSWYGAKILDKNKNKKILFCFVFLILLCLIGFKYVGFIERSINRIGTKLCLFDEIPILEIAMPVGISFYTLEAIGYLVDVYYGKYSAEKNLLRYASFISFFPKVLSGPIERGDRVISQFISDREFSYSKVKTGFLRIMFGYIQKVLVADQIAVLVNEVYDNISPETSGGILGIATILYGIQIYLDFAGYSNIAIGVAAVLGFDIMENFKQPYLAQSIKDFWRRWHYSLSSWLRDYIYIPLGGSRKGSMKKYFNIFIVFLVSGIWHGADWHFIMWGIIHGIYQVAGDVTAPICKYIRDKSRIKTDCFSYRLFKSIWVFFLVDTAWIFFRASSVRQSFEIVYRIFTDFRISDVIIGNTVFNGMTKYRVIVFAIFLPLMLIFDYLKEEKKDIIKWLDDQNVVFRWIIYLGMAFLVCLALLRSFGADASSFIYTRF